jgi:hypothetical protein
MRTASFVACLWPWLAAGLLVAGAPFELASPVAAQGGIDGTHDSGDATDAIDASIAWGVARDFWSFQKPLPQARPDIAETSWPSQRLDYFTLAAMESRGLSPSPEADRRTLIRRVTFDLTGLPPQPEEVDQFLGDARPDAYARVVERLMMSPRFGERLASMWLPLARYAEDQAHQVGNDTTMFYPNAHHYRQWVIDAFNRDLPYDQFILLQLAADKYPAAEHLPALGFLGLGPKYYNRNRLEIKADEWEDRVDTVTRTLLGLTVACARCHDHRFDPIPTEDYYALAGVFASTRMVNKTPDGRVIDRKVSADKMPPETLHIVEDDDPEDLHVFIRGQVTREGPLVQRHFLRILSPDRPVPFRDGSGRRELAEQITSPDNPLTARVIVNRLWGQFFGRPLVPTPSDFGHSGMPPTHPELLDDLALRFMENGWSIHRMVREFVLSSTYRQSSAHRAGPARIDAANRFLWRMNRRRLTVEQWRDTALFLSGELEWAGGKSLELDDPENRRRTVFGRVSRLELNDLLMQFDYPDANVHAERRSVTTTATQKLYMLNSPFILSRARAFAARLRAGEEETVPERLHRAYRLAFGRSPRGEEAVMAADFLDGTEAAGINRWEQFAQVLLVSNEMFYVD